jgi:uncharacterized protein (DUF1684 family)
MTQLIDSDFTADWQAWHAAKDDQFAAPHGFLAVTAIHWLTEEPERFDDVPGAWSTGADGIEVDLAGGESLTLEDGTVATGRHSFGPIPERGGVTAAFGDAIVEVARRGGRDLIRPRHPDNPRRLAFTGTPAYDPDPAYAVTARYTPYGQEVPTTVGSVVDGLEHVYGAVGELAFTLGGAEHTLVAFPGAAAGTLHVLFSDATAGVTTYGAVRSLSLPAPDANGEVVVDFNRATNLPCAYTPHATCPLPPAGNRLAVPVEAGEKTPVAFEEQE